MSEEIEGLHPDDRQELDWEKELVEPDEIPEGHKIYKQIVWLHLMGKVEEKNFYFSHEGIPKQDEIFAAIFSQRPDFKQYKSSIRLYGEPQEIGRDMVPNGQSILQHIDLNTGESDPPQFEEIKI